MWSCLVFETRTGRIVAEPDTTGLPRWSAAVNQPGSLEATFPLGHLTHAERQILRGILAPQRFSLAWRQGDWIAQAGPIWSHRVTAESVTVGASGLWGLLDRRLLFPREFSAITAPDADTHLGPTSLGTLAKHLVQVGLGRSGGSLPVVLPADWPGNHTRTYRGYELRPVGEALRQLVAEEHGPDIEFRPRLTASRTHLEWVMRIGEPYLEGNGAPPAWDYGTGLSDINVDADASLMSSRTWVRGDGWERGSLIGFHRDTTLTDAGWPLVDHVVTGHSSVQLPATLDRLATSYAALYRRPIELWTARVRTSSGEPRHYDLAPGFHGLFGITGHPWIPDGQYLRRVIGLDAANHPDELALTIEAGQGEL
ncbi:hypothetical protein M8C13_06310 [Crossiella sp. SN42]|uniref:hypothetical protein n=1 Tax=Crossiella sp. SN42 TaxID=2944808 RepID=UPI00207CA3D1|nr:hypothetical protein [Crossiella sp. SN42]MCO1575373.1 hypothetical protein [Crossiella sp. SN42]